MQLPRSYYSNGSTSQTTIRSGFEYFGSLKNGNHGGTLKMRADFCAMSSHGFISSLFKSCENDGVPKFRICAIA